MEMKKTIKYDSRLKGLRFEDDELIDENGEVIDLNKYMKAAYGDKTFDLSTTAKSEEIIEVDVYTEYDEEE